MIQRALFINVIKEMQKESACSPGQILFFACFWIKDEIKMQKSGCLLKTGFKFRNSANRSGRKIRFVYNYLSFGKMRFRN